jgi:8-oxo-dGTP pyrophosphatase MutT (NUDIX family)
MPEQPSIEPSMQEPTEPRQAASVIVVRGGRTALEVLLLRRSPAARFMAGVWVFPGGAVDPGEAHRDAAVREVQEEAGLTLPGAAELIPFSRWITPKPSPIRFDTHFFLATAPPGQEAQADGGEMVDAAWYTPAGALDAHRRGELELVFPTIKHLEQLATFAGADELIEWATGREIVAVEPRIVHVTGESARVELPGDE